MTDRAKPMNNAGKPAKNIPLTRVNDNLKNFQPHYNRGDSGGVESDRAKEVEAILGLETAPDGLEQHLLTRDEKGKHASLGMKGTTKA